MKTASADRAVAGGILESCDSRAALINKDLYRITDFNKTWQVNKVDFLRKVAESNPQFFPQPGVETERFFSLPSTHFAHRPTQRPGPSSSRLFSGERAG